jgi:hypothetical protein
MRMMIPRSLQQFAGSRLLSVEKSCNLADHTTLGHG